MKLQEKTNARLFVKLLMIACVLIAGLSVGNLFSMKVHAQGTATASTSGVIRESADTSSSKMASVKAGDKLDVIAQVTASDGYTWYKVYVDDTRKGYIRADLVSKVEGSISTESASSAGSSSDDSATDSDQSEVTTVGSKNSSTSSDSKTETDTKKETDTESKPESIVVNVSESTVAAAKVKGSSVRVRETPSTSGNIKGNAKGDTEVTVSGESVDSDGNTWYQVSFNSGDSTINGFIRSDFLEVTQSVETPTEETTQEAETEVPEEEPINDDYELNYEENDEGIQEWFLYDNLKGTKQSLNNIFEIVQQSQDSEKSDNDQLKKMKIILIIMAVVILLLVIGITILLFKVKDSYEYDDDDEDEDEDDEEEEYVPVRRKKTPAKLPGKVRPSRYEDDDDDEDEDEDDEDDEEEPIVKPTHKKQQPSSKKGDANWQSKNFLDVDDDMEFEFLDLK